MSKTRKKNRRKYSRKKTKSCGCGVKLSKLFNLFKVTKKRKPKKQKGGGWSSSKIHLQQVGGGWPYA